MLNLEIYKNLLDKNTNYGLGFNDHSKSRYHSFKYCIEYLQKINNSEILELGTTRSFVSGEFEGCNSDDAKYWEPNNYNIWDFGAGCFTLIFGQLSNKNLTTLDINGDHMQRCKIMTDSLGIKCDHIISNSIDFLQKTDKKFDLIYLDTFDITPIEPAELGQKQEAEIIVNRNLLKENGLLLIDDVLNDTPCRFGSPDNKFGKSTLSLPYLLDNNFYIVFEGYQYILKKNT